MNFYFFMLLDGIILKLNQKLKTNEGKEAVYKARGALIGMMEGDGTAFKVFMKIMRWAYRYKYISEDEYVLCKKMTTENLPVYELPTKLNHIRGKKHPWQEFTTQKLTRR